MKIVIDLGHGVGKDRGAEGIIKEETIINNVGFLVIKKLRSLGHNVLTVRPNSASSVLNSLAQRVNAANNFGADLYVSIHANAGGGIGTEIYTYRGKEVVEARNVLNNLVALGFRNRGIKNQNLYVINHTNAKAMLLEICFTDTKSDVDLYKRIGDNAIANEIVKGLTGKEPVQITDNSFKVKITADVLNVRNGAGVQFKVNTTVKKGEVYTIVDVKNGFGKLKSGAGFISLNYTTKI